MVSQKNARLGRRALEEGKGKKNASRLLIGQLDGVDKHVGGELTHLEGRNEEGSGAWTKASSIGRVGAS